MRPLMTVLSALAVLGASFASTGVAERVAHVARRAPDVISIRASRFAMGSDDADVAFAVALCRAHAAEPAACQPATFADEQPRHYVKLRGYRMDRTEVSRASYLRCVAQGACVPPRAEAAWTLQPQYPVTGVRAAEAERYCAFVGGRLPTEAEWEHAARGDGTRRFPWGMHWNPMLANGGRPRAPDGAASSVLSAVLSAVGSFTDGKSAYGLLDMAGNAWELTADRYASDAYARARSTDPTGPEQGQARVLRGGGAGSPPHALRATARASLDEGESRTDVGFRCAYELPLDAVRETADAHP